MKPGPLRLTLSLMVSLLLLGPARAPAAALVSDAPRASAASWPGALGGPDTQPGWSYSRSRSHWRLRHPDRMGSEIGLGFLGVVVGGALGVAGSFLVPCKTGGAFDPSCGSSRLVGFVAGGLVGIPVGVWVGGGLMKGEGSLWATLLGSGVGAAGALGLMHAFPDSSVGYLSLLLLPMTFSIVAYEVTHALSQPPPSPDTPSEAPPSESLVSRAPRAPRLQPLVALTAGGALLGLGGHF